MRSAFVGLSLVATLAVPPATGALSTHHNPLATNPAARVLVIFRSSWGPPGASGSERLVLKTDRRAVLHTTHAVSLEVPTERTYRFRLRPRTYESVRAALAAARLRSLKSEYESPNARPNDPTYTISANSASIDVQWRAIREGRVPGRLVRLIRLLYAIGNR
jgi:hypothetical protein